MQPLSHHTITLGIAHSMVTNTGNQLKQIHMCLVRLAWICRFRLEGSVWLVWFGRFGLVGLVWWVWFCNQGLVGLVWLVLVAKLWFGKFGLVDGRVVLESMVIGMVLHSAQFASLMHMLLHLFSNCAYFAYFTYFPTYASVLDKVLLIMKGQIIQVSTRYLVSQSVTALGKLLPDFGPIQKTNKKKT